MLETAVGIRNGNGQRQPKHPHRIRDDRFALRKPHATIMQRSEQTKIWTRRRLTPHLTSQLQKTRNDEPLHSKIVNFGRRVGSKRLRTSHNSFFDRFLPTVQHPAIGVAERFVVIVANKHSREYVCVRRRRNKDATDESE